MIGTTVSHYKIIEKIGAGGMGVIYKAQDLKLDRFVALKFLPPHLTTSKEEKQRFIHEAKAASSLDHNNICNIYEIDETKPAPGEPGGGQLFIAMTYYEGETLQLKIENGLLKIEEAIEYAIQVGQGLQKAHEKEIVHRDIKPANIMVTNEGVVKILDFGLAKLSTQTKLTKESTTLGTVSYMSPEQAKGEDVDLRTDIWSFGVIIYEMLTGQLPFKGEYESAVIYSIINDPHEPVTGLRTGVPMELERIINKCLQKNPEDRYQHMDELIVDLRSLQKDSDSIVDTAKISEVKDSGHQRFNQLLKPGIIIIVAVIIAIIYFTVVQKAESHAPIPIAVIDFVNETGENELSSLSGMLTTALEQSKRLSVITRSRMFDILKQMNKENVDYIDETLGREIANRAGIKVLVLPSIQKFDQIYNIDIKVIDPLEDEYLHTDNESGEGQASILDMIDLLAENTRERLEETGEEIQLTATPVSELTTTNLEAYHHYYNGQEYIDKLMFTEAEKEFEKAIALDSTFGLAYYRLAYAINWENEPQRAQEPINKAFKYIDQIPEKEKYLVRFVKMSADSAWGEAGLNILRDMEKVYPNDKEMIYNIGDISWHIYEFEDAIKYLEKVLEMDSKSIRTLQHLIWTYRDIGDYDQMLKNAKKYASVSGSAEAYFLLAEAYEYVGESEEASANFKRAIKINPNNDQYHVRLGFFLLKKGMFKFAILCYDKAIELNPLDTEIYFLRATCFSRIGESNKAKKDFQKVLEIDPDHRWALFWYGELLIKLKKYKKADIIISRREKVYPQSIGESALRAFLLAARGEKDKALEINLETFGKLEVLLILKMKEEVIRYLNEDFDRIKQRQTSSYLEFINYPPYEFLRSDPRFQEILAKHKKIYEENLRKYGDIDI